MSFLPSSGPISFTDINSQFSYGNDLGSYIGKRYYKSIDISLFRDEGDNADSFGWSDSTTYLMENVSGLGSNILMHGYTPSTDLQLDFSDLPTHTHVRYKCKWHCVDSLDNESSWLAVDGTILAGFSKGAGEPVYFINGVASKTFYAADYSYAPFGPAHGLTPYNGYIDFDTGWIIHTSSNISINHHIGADQAQWDEAMYISHSSFELMNARLFTSPLRFSDFYSTAKV